MAKNIDLMTRKVHRWGAVIFAVPLLIIITSGLLLQVKKQVSWVQPPTLKGLALNESPQQSWSNILDIARNVPEADVAEWGDIDRLDVRLSKGTVKVQCVNRWEIQIDLQSGEVLSTNYRRSDLIESLHDGSFFSEFVKVGIFLPNGMALFVLWFTGVWLWWLPIRKRHMARARAATD